MVLNLAIENGLLGSKKFGFIPTAQNGANTGMIIANSVVEKAIVTWGWFVGIGKWAAQRTNTFVDPTYLFGSQKRSFIYVVALNTNKIFTTPANAPAQS